MRILMVSGASAQLLTGTSTEGVGWGFNCAEAKGLVEFADSCGNLHTTESSVTIFLVFAGVLSNLRTTLSLGSGYLGGEAFKYFCPR